MRVAAGELTEGLANLENLIAELSGRDRKFNEADTRFHIIDRLLVECLGWPAIPDEFRLERSQGRDYADYELGKPVSVIWEAKREGKTFEVPMRRASNHVHSISSVMLLSPECKAAIEQVNSYCIQRGAEIAVATNGSQLIAFVAERDLSESSKSKCVLFDSLDQLRASFPRVWQLLSPGGVARRTLIEHLDRAAAPKPPEKLSAAIPNYPQFREPSDLQRSMSDIAELLLLSVSDQPEVERQFYENCYCQSGALGQHALISKQMLNARYSSLFPDAEDAAVAKPVSGKGAKPQLTPEILAEAISNHPIALVGDVGVGKSSFLKHLMYVSAFSEFQHAIYAYVNLGRKGALWDDISALVLDQIEAALIEENNIDITEAAFVKAVYKKDIKRFEKTIYGEQREENPALYNEKLLAMLDAKQSNKAEHLRSSIEYLSREKRKQIIIALDNADQRSAAVQQEAFVIAQNLAADWKATVFISVRPRTFFVSKRSGALSAYPHRIFTIAPPRIDEVIVRRLVFALNIAEGKLQLNRLRGVSVKLGKIATLIRVVMDSIDRSDEVKIFLENITGGNVRSLIEFLAGMFGNPNVDLQSVVISLEQSDRYFIPVHEFWKAALKGDYQYFDPEKVIAANLFSVHTDDAREHFLLPLILGLLDESAPRRNAEGFVSYDVLKHEIQLFGFKPAVIDATIRTANNKKLIEAPDRITFEEDEDGSYGLVPSAFRINTIGAYHLKTWMTSFSYLDAVVVDTPIFDETVADQLRTNIRSFALSDRYERAIKFRDYLSKIWVDMNISPTYLDWDAACREGQTQLDRVAASMTKRGQR